MREKFKNAVIENMGKIIAGLLVAAIVGVFTTIVVEPIKQVVQLPGEVRGWQQDFESRQVDFESRQITFLKSLEKQTQADSTIFKQLEKLNKSNDLIEVEVAVIKTKIATIGDELPVLHQRFNDIENTMKNAQSFSDYAYHSTINTQHNEQTTN